MNIFLKILISTIFVFLSAHIKAEGNTVKVYNDKFSRYAADNTNSNASHSTKNKNSNKEENYSFDEVSVNFRNIELGDIKKNRLYRSSTPIDSEINLNKACDRLLEKSGIKSTMNLCDNEGDMRSFPGFSDTYYSTTHIIALDIAWDYRSGNFNEKIERGLKFLSLHPTPWLIHGYEGIDRTGFVCMLLEAICGADADEIINDYMISYENCHNIIKDSKQYNAIAEDTIHKMLMYVTKTGTIEEMKKCDLPKKVASYIKENTKLNDTNLRIIREKLCK